MYCQATQRVHEMIRAYGLALKLCEFNKPENCSVNDVFIARGLRAEITCFLLFAYDKTYHP